MTITGTLRGRPLSAYWVDGELRAEDIEPKSWFSAMVKAGVTVSLPGL